MILRAKFASFPLETLSDIKCHIVQMMNSLIKYLVYKINDKNPDKNLSLDLTQYPIIINVFDDNIA